MKRVSVCLLLNENYWETIYSFERTNFAIAEKKGEIVIKDAPKEYIKLIDDVEVELLVGYNAQTDKRLIEYFTPIATEMVFVDSSNNSRRYNSLFAKATFEYVCVFQPLVFLQSNWLIELIYFHESVNNSGVLGICGNFKDVELAPLPSKEMESFINVFYPKQRRVNEKGLLFFLRQHLYFVGALDESYDFYNGAEFTQFQSRFSANGLENYYITTQTSVWLGLYDTQKASHIKTEQSNAFIEKSLLSMKKNKSYYLPLLP